MSKKVLIVNKFYYNRGGAEVVAIAMCEALRAKGYSVDVIEFVDFSHSPKNLMIRAKLNSKQKPLNSLCDLQNKYGFSQKLLDLQNE